MERATGQSLCHKNSVFLNNRSQLKLDDPAKQMLLEVALFERHWMFRTAVKESAMLESQVQNYLTALGECLCLTQMIVRKTTWLRHSNQLTQTTALESSVSGLSSSAAPAII
jgi:hypothetical protein